MISDILAPGIKLEIFRRKNSLGFDVKEVQYESQLLDILNDTTIEIAVPMENSHIVPVEVSDTYEIIFYTGRGPFQGFGIIKNRSRERGIPVLTVELITEIKKYQRRQFYRLQCLMDINYRIITKEEAYCVMRLERKLYESEEEKKKLESFITKSQAQWLLAKATDISGGGCRFISDTQYMEGQLGELRFIVGEDEEKEIFEFEYEFISSEQKDGRPEVFENRVKFINVDSLMQENFIRYIFKEERKNIQHERGYSK